MNLQLLPRRALGDGLRRTMLAVEGRRTPDQIRVLLYHSIDDSGSTLSVSGAQFKTHLEMLKGEGWRTLSVAGYLERLGKPPSRERECLLTFDDGYENFYEVAAPILLDLGFRATVFLPTDYIGDFPGWFERDRESIASFLGRFNFSVPERHCLDSMMRAAAGRRLMNKAQIRELSRAGFDFQSHSAGHHFLPLLSDDALARDLARSGQFLTQELAIHSPMLCYPYGAYNARVSETARQLGFRAAVLAEYINGSSDEFAIGRVPISQELGLPYLRFALSPALDRYTRWRKMRTPNGLIGDGLAL